jgi:hypothetical protein
MGYILIPNYGIEPFKALGSTPAEDFGGGAEVTNDNLLISLWTIDSASPGGIPLTGRHLKPAPQTPTGLSEIQAQEAAQGIENLTRTYEETVFDSRYSARFVLQDTGQPGGEGEEPTLPPNMLAILRPPQDMIDAAMRVFGDVRLDSSTPNGLYAVWKNSAQDLFCWDVAFTEVGNAHLNTYPYYVGNIIYAPGFAKTNGANGVFPEFFATDPYTPQGLFDLCNAMKQGRFYVPLLFPSPGLDQVYRVTVSWPHRPAFR